MATQSCLTNAAIRCATDVEFLKLAATVFTAFTAGAIALLIARYNFRTDQSKTVNQELIKKRLEIYGNVVPKINDVFCYTRFVGGWRTFNPQEIIDRKREVDRVFHVYRPIFTQEVFEAYELFRRACFREYNAYGENATIRVDLEEARKNWREKWQESWSEWFAGEDPFAPDIAESYHGLLVVLAREIGVRETPVRKRIRELLGGFAAQLRRLGRSWRFIYPFSLLPGSERLRIEEGPPADKPWKRGGGE
jgi:hypothetical protein